MLVPFVFPCEIRLPITMRLRLSVMRRYGGTECVRSGGCFCTKRKNRNDEDARFVDTRSNVNTGYDLARAFCLCVDINSSTVIFYIVVGSCCPSDDHAHRHVVA